MHGTRHIHDEDIFAGRDLVFGHPFGGLQHEQKKVLFLSFEKKESRFDSFSGKTVLQNKIPVTTPLL